MGPSRFVCLTGMPHPDYRGGKPQAVYVDPWKVMFIETSIYNALRYDSQEAQRQAMWSLHDEVTRIGKELHQLRNLTVFDEQGHRGIQQALEAAHALEAAGALVGSVTRQSSIYHPALECTQVGLAAGTVEQTVMLCRIYVSEPPNVVAALVEKAKGLA